MTDFEDKEIKVGDTVIVSNLNILRRGIVLKVNKVKVTVGDPRGLYKSYCTPDQVFVLPGNLYDKLITEKI
jgi:hypothetical protein